MTDFRTAARALRDRADLLDHVAQYVGPLPIVVLEEDSNGEPLDTHDPNKRLHEVIKGLRDLARTLDALEYDVDDFMKESQCYLAELRELDEAKASDAEEGFLDSMAYADDCRDMY